LTAPALCVDGGSSFIVKLPVEKKLGGGPRRVGGAEEEIYEGRVCWRKAMPEISDWGGGQVERGAHFDPSICPLISAKDRRALRYTFLSAGRQNFGFDRKGEAENHGLHELQIHYATDNDDENPSRKRRDKTSRRKTESVNLRIPLSRVGQSQLHASLGGRSSTPALTLNCHSVLCKNPRASCSGCPPPELFQASQLGGILQSSLVPFAGLAQVGSTERPRFCRASCRRHEGWPAGLF
jgi:hypothetical protein